MEEYKPTMLTKFKLYIRCMNIKVENDKNNCVGLIRENCITNVVSLERQYGEGKESRRQTYCGSILILLSGGNTKTQTLLSWLLEL